MVVGRELILRGRRSVRRASRTSAAGAAVFVFFLTSLAATAASAANIAAETAGAEAVTQSHSSYGERARVRIKDTACDNKRADADYYRNNPNDEFRVTADGCGKTAYSGYSSNKVTLLRACVRNSNPFDKNRCSGWVGA